MLPKSIWAFFRVPTLVTQLQNWAKMAISLSIFANFEAGKPIFRQMSFFENWKLSFSVAQIDLGIFSGIYCSNPALNWAQMAVSLPILSILKLGSHFFGRCRFFEHWRLSFTFVKIYNPCPCPAYPMGYRGLKLCGVLGINQLNSSSEVNI